MENRRRPGELTAGRGPEICIEASGAPAALQSAIRVAGQEATIAVCDEDGASAMGVVLRYRTPDGDG